MISIIIPVHNGAKYIERAINSVKAQYADWELIVVNDHSTDDTDKILKKYSADNDQRISVIESNTLGVTDARVAGVKKADGDYIFFMDADDTLPLNTIETMAKKIAANPSVDMAIGDFIEVRDNKETRISYGETSMNNASQLFDWIIDNRMGYLWGKAIRKELFLSLPYIPSKLKFCEDYVQMLQLTLSANRIIHIGTQSYNYYQNPTSACNSIKSKSDFYSQFYNLSVALNDLTEIMRTWDVSQYKINRIKVMFLFYTRLYLAIAGRWREDKSHLRYKYKTWMKDKSLYEDVLYNKRRRRQTRLAYRMPWLMAMVYVPILRYKHHRIR